MNERELQIQYPATVGTIFRVAAVLALLFCGLARGQGDADFNPQPATDDLVLPMPGGARMVFRRVDVPGEGFWGDEKRIVQIGDAEGGIFEGLQRVQIHGSFRDQGGWHYYLGKYEVTKGQVAAVLGLDAFAAASGWSADRALPDQSAGERAKALRYPAVALDWLTIQTFVARYNEWLFEAAQTQRRARLPRVEGVPGFVRLPTEIEWEYAARGGRQALDGGSFSERLPFDPDQARKYSWNLDNARRSLRPVGLRESTPPGLHDLFGNAQELVGERFRPEIRQGKPGALSARGGSVYTPAAELRASLRSEVESYQWNRDREIMGRLKSPTTGFRLALGSNVLFQPGVKARLAREYESYRRGVRAATPVGRSLDNPVVQAAGSLGGADDTIAALIEANPQLSRELRAVQARIQDAGRQLDRGLKAAARASARDMLLTATSLGRDVFKLHGLKTRARDQVEALARTSTRYQRLLADIDSQIEQRENSVATLAARYAELVGRLGEAGESYVAAAIGELRQDELTRRAARALELMQSHLQQYRETRRPAQARWREDFQREFKDLAD